MARKNVSRGYSYFHNYKREMYSNKFQNVFIFLDWYYEKSKSIFIYF